MAWHKWFVRGLVFTILAGAVAGTLVYQHWTDPAAVRLAVLGKIAAMLPGGAVTLDSASLHLLGNIRVHEMHLARRDDPTAEVAHIPSAILYHNKEKMLDGELTFRKIELYRPRLRVVRDQDGKWNVQGLAGVSKPGQPVPTIVVHQATIQLEDYSREDGAPFKLELTKANVTLINDPLDVVTIDGAAQSDLFGKVVVHGTWQRHAQEIELSIRTLGTRLDNALLDRLACFCPASKLKGLQVSGEAQVQVNLVYRPTAEPPWSLSAQCQVAKAALRHPELPAPLEDMHANVRFDGAVLRVDSLRGRLGAATVTGHGAGRLPCPEQHFNASLRIEHLDVNDSLLPYLPEKTQPLMNLYQPRGKITLQIDVARRNGQWAPLADGQESRISAQPEQMSACFDRFRYPLDDITGHVKFILPLKRFQVDLIAHASGRPVAIVGHWQGESGRIDSNLDITATEVPIDARLIAALPEPTQTTVKSFNASGKVDVKAHIRRRLADAKYHTEYHLKLHDGAVRWDEFPYHLSQVAGHIDVYPNAGAWQFHDLHGRHGDGTVAIYARAAEPDDRHSQSGVYVELTGKNLPLDGELHAALRTKPSLAKAWATFQPSGRLNFTAAIDHRGKRPEDLEVRVDVKGPSVRPAFCPYPLHDVAGHFHLHDQRLELRRLSATHGPTRWYLENGSVDFHPGGALYAELPELQAEHLRLDRDLIAAMPLKMRDATASLRCNDSLRLKTRLVVAVEGEGPGGSAALPDVFWDGQIWLNDAALTVGLDLQRVTGTAACMGRYNGRQLTGLAGNIILERAAVYNQPFRNLKAKFHVKEDAPELLLLDLNAPIFGGDVAGQISLDFHDRPRFELNLTASQIDLKEFGRHNFGKDELAGSLIARLFLTGIGNDPGSLDGHGTLDIPNGKLLNLPFLLDLIKFLGLRWPDRTMFEEMHTQYAIRGRRVTVQKLELFGNAVSFTGKGAINLDGSDLHLDMYPSWARIEQLLPPAIRSVPPALSKNVLTVEARGKVTGDSKDIKFTKKPMPILVDPLLHLRDRLIGSPAMDSRRPVEFAPMNPAMTRKEP